MGIFKRVSDIIAANLNDLVEQYEDPEKMLKQAIGEMESSIEKFRRRVAKAMAAETIVAMGLTENRELAEQWNGRAEVAIAVGNDALALKAIARRREHEKLAIALADQYEAASQASMTLRRKLDGMQAKLSDAKRRLGSLTARKRAADARLETQHRAFDAQLDEDPFAKFDRMCEKVELAEAEANALRELASSQYLDPLFESEPDDSKLELEAELLEMKRRLEV